jgi:anti-anti-sigma factor
MPVAAAPQSPSAAPPVPPPPRRKPDSNDPWASEELIKNTERKPPRIVLPQSGLAALPGRLRGEAAKAKPPEPSAPRPTLRATPVPRLPNLPPPRAVALLSGVLPTSTEKASASSIAREIAEERRRSLTAADRAAEPPQRSEAAQVDAKPAEPPPAQPVPPPPMRPAGDEAETPEPPASAQQQPESAQRSFRDELEQSRVVEHDAAPEPNDEQGLRPHRRGSHPTTGRLRQRPAKEEISFELSGGVLVVSGAIGYDLDRRFNEACQRMVASPETRLVLDLSKVSYLSSTYLGVIAPLYAATTKAGKTLVLRAQAKVARVLRLSGFDRLGEVEVVEDPR